MTTTEWGRISFENPNGRITNVIIQAAKYNESLREGVTFSLQVEGNNTSIFAGDIQGFFIDFADNKEPATGSLSGQVIINLIQGDDTILWAGTKANNMNGMAANAAEGALPTMAATLAWSSRVLAPAVAMLISRPSLSKASTLMHWMASDLASACKTPSMRREP